MVNLTINRVEVDFPYEPYPVQVRYMSHVIEALRSGQNALLESPTGTGKTLCLLCAALAWRSTYIAALQAHSQTGGECTRGATELLENAGFRPLQGAATTIAAVINPGSNASLAAPRIVFSSRTHSQLSQAVSELKKTSYNPSMSILASRDQLCIHDIANNLSSSRLNAMCRRITAPSRRQCRYHLPVASNRRHENRASELIDKLHSQPPMDIEDLRKFGSSESACPFFLSRAAARSEACEILFLPYNYLMDVSSRRSLDIDWANDIIIIDEAHNLESICSDAISFELTPSVRSACASELDKLVEQTVCPGGLKIPALQSLATTDKGLDSLIGSENPDLLEIRRMRTLLVKLEQFISEVNLDRGENSGTLFKAFTGEELRRLVEKSDGPTLETFELFLETIDRAMGLQAETTKLTSGKPSDSGEQQQSSNVSSALRVFQNAMRVLFESAAARDSHSFRAVVQSTKHIGSAGRTLSYWCFSPAIAMRTVTQLNIRCLLLTSGTLSPMDWFASELGVSFPVRLESPHVITKPQVWVGVLRAGPSIGGVKGGRLTSAYSARGEAMHIELGKTMIRLATLVPDGLLVFFPSYSALYACSESWRKHGPGPNRAKPSVWEHILRHKHIIVEERESSKIVAAILAHKTNVDSGVGSILLAVCRGKVSEGIDFSDEYGRAVVITGLPYPSAFDPKVILKREFQDQELKRAQQGNSESGRSRAVPANKLLSGSQWYTAQALRAVNQAVGRAIRHRFDYGAILLCDERYQSAHLQGQISKWLRPSIVVHSTFEDGEKSLERFFTGAEMSDFAKEGLTRRAQAKKRSQAKQTRRQRDENSTEVVTAAQKVIGRLLPPPKTESQFLAQIMSFSEEVGAESGKNVAQTRSDIAPPSSTPSGNVFALTSQIAKGGMLDSGSMYRIEGEEAGAVEKKRGAEQRLSEQFLASRLKRVEQGKLDGSAVPGTGIKRRRFATPAQTLDPRKGAPSQPGKQEKLSDRVKKLFNVEDRRKFLVTLKELVDLQKTLKEGIGPLQSAQDLESNKEKGVTRVRDLVRMVRDRAKQSPSTSDYEALLYDLKVKIPEAFRRDYQATLKREQSA